MESTRRSLLRMGAMGTLAFMVGNKTLTITPAQARDQNIPFRMLSDRQVQALSRLAELAVPGATEAGIVHYIDQQLSLPADECLLMIRYLGVEAPFSDFYLGALEAFESSARKQFGADFGELKNAQAESLFSSATSADPAGWQGPPAPFFLFVLRGDACDLIYGTQAGFEQLDVPYMAHITPSTPW